jgi:hypothetical protein
MRVTAVAVSHGKKRAVVISEKRLQKFIKAAFSHL